MQNVIFCLSQDNTKHQPSKLVTFSGNRPKLLRFWYKRPCFGYYLSNLTDMQYSGKHEKGIATCSPHALIRSECYNVFTSFR